MTGRAFKDDAAGHPSRWVDAADMERLKEIRQRGCDCNDEDACRFARERDEARAEVERLKETLFEVRTESAKIDNERLLEIQRLKALVPPEVERSGGGVSQASWSVFAEKVVEERDEAIEQRDAWKHQCDLASEAQADALNKVAQLQAELALAQALHDVAVKERDYARFKFVHLEHELKER